MLQLVSGFWSTASTIRAKIAMVGWFLVSGVGWLSGVSWLQWCQLVAMVSAGRHGSSSSPSPCGRSPPNRSGNAGRFSAMKSRRARTRSSRVGSNTLWPSGPSRPGQSQPTASHANSIPNGLWERPHRYTPFSFTPPLLCGDSAHAMGYRMWPRTSRAASKCTLGAHNSGPNARTRLRPRARPERPIQEEQAPPPLPRWREEPQPRKPPRATLPLLLG